MNGSKKNKRLTIMIVPHDTSTGGVRYFNISTSFIRLTGIFCALLITLSAIGMAISVGKIVDYAKFKNLLQENKILKRDIKTFASEKKKLERHLASFKEQVAGLTKLAGLIEGPIKRVSGGRGGSRNNRLRLSTIPLESIGEINQSLGYMQEEALELEQDIREIKEILEKKGAKSKLAAIPFILPVRRGKLTSGFGYRRSPFTGQREFHGGIDISADVGTSVLAPADGKVIDVGWDNIYGRFLKISHGYGYKTVYGHNSVIMVKEGEWVKRGDVIALVGNTGRSTGPHLHYEVWLNNKVIDPWRCILQ